MLNPAEACRAVESDGLVRPPIGISAYGSTVFALFRHAPLFLANSLCDLDLGAADPNRRIHLRPGMSFTRAANTHLQLSIGDVFDRRRRRDFGYVAEIQLTSSGRGAKLRPYLNSLISGVFSFASSA